MNAPQVLAAGLWLGTSNSIFRLWETKRNGWRVEDTTGAVYKQEDFPDGLSVAYERMAEKVRAPWPEQTR